MDNKYICYHKLEKLLDGELERYYALISDLRRIQKDYSSINDPFIDGYIDSFIGIIIRTLETRKIISKEPESVKYIITISTIVGEHFIDIDKYKYPFGSNFTDNTISASEFKKKAMFFDTKEDANTYLIDMEIKEEYIRTEVRKVLLYDSGIVVIVTDDDEATPIEILEV